MPSYQHIIEFIRETFGQEKAFIPLHAPYFGGNERKYVLDTIDSTFVSSVGAYVTQFEELMKNFTGCQYAIATVNGTTALHLALQLAGVTQGTDVITQPLTFVATANAIIQAGGNPVFIDVDADTMGLSAQALEKFLKENITANGLGQPINKLSGNRLAACVPMHTFGFPARIQEIVAICNAYSIPVVEDAAESLGSYVHQQHTGSFGLMGTFSFNGNKTVTSGGGGAIVTNDASIAEKAKHLSTTAKQPHAYEFYHDEVAYNYRMPNINAALACAQLEQLPTILAAKRKLAATYQAFFENNTEIEFRTGIEHTTPNYWLNTIQFSTHLLQQQFLQATNQAAVMTRPIWQLMTHLPMYKNCIAAPIPVATQLAQTIVNIPSSYLP